MVIITKNEIVPLDDRCIYVDRGLLVIESEINSRYVKNIPDNAIQQIAVAFAENKNYLEFEDAELVFEEGEEDDA